MNTNNMKNIQLSQAKFMMGENTQSGFTLIELMISLVLGLLIAAAAMQVYVINFKTTTVQQSTSDLTDASIFGIQLLESHIRMANMGNVVEQINDTTLDGGIVLSGLNIGQVATDGSDNYTNTGYLSRSTGDTGTGTDGWTGDSKMDVGSDQLTIQFKNITGVDIPDCEGTNIAPDEIVIERFFLRNQGTDLALACDAGRIAVTTVQEKVTDPATGTTTTVDKDKYTLSNFGDKGQHRIVEY